MMKRSYLIILALCCLFFASCRNGRKPKNEVEKYVRPVEMTISRQDTDIVISLTKEYLEKVKSGDIDGALGMLYYLDKDKKVGPVPADLAKRQRESLKAFPVYGYKIDFLKFFRETDSEVKYSLVISNPEKSKQPAIISAMIRPMREDGKWYLTLADTQSENVQSELDHIK